MRALAVGERLWLRLQDALEAAGLMAADAQAPDFWRSSGWHLLDRRDDGRHLATPDFLRAYLLRPELRPAEELCVAERAMHEALLEAPDRPITPVGLFVSPGS